MTDTDIAWCAGLFEGEGSIFIASQIRTNGKRYQYARATLKMTDLDVIEKFHQLVGCGIVVKQTKPQSENRKLTYCWQLTTKNELIDLMLKFYPYLGERRKAKIKEVLIPE